MPHLICQPLTYSISAESDAAVFSSSEWWFTLLLFLYLTLTMCMFIDALKLIVFVFLTDENSENSEDENSENSEDENSILSLKVKAYLASQPHLLLYEEMFENMDENVSFGTINRCLAEKKGESGVQTVKLRGNGLGMEWAITTMEVFCPLNNIWFS